jgi:hypothetical protein
MATVAADAIQRKAKSVTVLETENLRANVSSCS